MIHTIEILFFLMIIYVLFFSFFTRDVITIVIESYSQIIFFRVIVCHHCKPITLGGKFRVFSLKTFPRCSRFPVEHVAKLRFQNFLRWVIRKAARTTSLRNFIVRNIQDWSLAIMCREIFGIDSNLQMLLYNYQSCV